MRRGLTVTAVAESEDGPVAAGAAPAGRRRDRDRRRRDAARRAPPGPRRRVTGALVEDALEHGAETVFLSAGSEDIARVYARLGFQRVGTACIVG